MVYMRLSIKDIREECKDEKDKCLEEWASASVNTRID